VTRDLRKTGSRALMSNILDPIDKPDIERIPSADQPM
jgi:hypothetical protein